MAKKVNELSQVKARQTKLGKKSNEELIQIIIKKDKVERNLNNQIKNLKGEVNNLSSRVKNFTSDIEGTTQLVEAYKDKISAYQDKIDVLTIESKDNYSRYLEENKKAITLDNKAKMLVIGTYIMTAIAIISVVIALL